MDPKRRIHQSRLSEDMELINLDEIDDDEITRKKLHEWALKDSKGEIPTNTATSFMFFDFHKSTTLRALKEGDSEVAEGDASPSQTIDIQAKDAQAKDTRAKEFQAKGTRAKVSQANDTPLEGERYQFPDWTTHIAESPEMNQKKPTPSRYRHTRRMSSTVIKPLVVRRQHQHQRQHPAIPPVPPIPEKYRAEWEWQEMKRRAELTNADYPGFHPGKKPVDTRYIRTDRPLYSTTTDAAKSEASRRANEKRQKAFDAVVLEDEPGQAKGKENERGGTGYGSNPRRRSDVRLPRSPGMLNLAQQKLVGSNASPEADRSLPRFPEPVMKHDPGDDEDIADDVKEQWLLSRPLREVNATYVDSIDFASEVASMEAEAEEKEKRMSLK